MKIYFFIFIEALICLLLAILLFFYYARKGTNPYVIITSIFSWFLNFFMVTLLPYDICLTNKLKTNQNLTDSEEITCQLKKFSIE